jgi:DNA-binding XRE family transcriptional regulator
VSKSLPVIQRPVTRGDCANVPRPCPFTDCRYSLVNAPYSAKKPRGPQSALSPEQRRNVTRMRRSGAKVKEIADRYGVSIQTIYTLLKGRKAPKHSCALDVADEGEHTQEEIAEAMGVTRQWINKVEAVAITKMRQALARGVGGNVIAKSNVADYFADGVQGFTEPSAGPYHHGKDGDGEDAEERDTRPGT